MSPAAEDAAWVMAEISVPARAVRECVSDVERFLRLNPYLQIECFERLPPDARGAPRYRLAAINEMNGVRAERVLTLDTIDAKSVFTLHYDSGLKRSTRVRLLEAARGAALEIREEYAPREEGPVEMREVDRSLSYWLASIRGYLARRERWGWVPGYRAWSGGYWLRMTPRERRITRMMVWIAGLEFVVFLFVFAVFWIELQRG
ncbi:MAG: hypothetical protein HY017_24575 [Betaproteobacteria bacterium]|nr:hypothetical protein [Betaproteobacteria bacterium]